LEEDETMREAASMKELQTDRGGEILPIIGFTAPDSSANNSLRSIVTAPLRAEIAASRPKEFTAHLTAYLSA